MGNLAEYTIDEIILKVDKAFKSNPILTKLGEIEGKKLEKFTMGREKGEYHSIVDLVSSSTMFLDRTKRSGFPTEIDRLKILGMFDLLNIIDMPCMICKLPYSSRLGCSYADGDDEVYTFQQNNERLCFYCVFAFSTYNLGASFKIEILDKFSNIQVTKKKSIECWNST